MDTGTAHTDADNVEALFLPTELNFRVTAHKKFASTTEKDMYMIWKDNGASSHCTISGKWRIDVTFFPE